jgi:hypothetical protein
MTNVKKAGILSLPESERALESSAKSVIPTSEERDIMPEIPPNSICQSL